MFLLASLSDLEYAKDCVLFLVVIAKIYNIRVDTLGSKGVRVQMLESTKNQRDWSLLIWLTMFSYSAFLTSQRCYTAMPLVLDC